MDVRSNSPLQDPPADYCPVGADRWFTIPSGPDRGKQLFYIDHETGPDARRTVVFVHGNPESSYTYRHVRDALIGSGLSLRIVAMDHIGFGLSDQAHYEMVEVHHADNLRALIHHLDLRNVTLVLHDWGGPIGAGAFIDDPDRVRSIVALNTTIFPMPDEGYTYEDFPYRFLPWCHTPTLVPDSLWPGVAAYVVPHGTPQPARSFVARLVATTARYKLGRLTNADPEYVFAKALDSTANARSSKRFVRQTPAWGHGYRYDDPVVGAIDNSEFYRSLQQRVPAAWGPEGTDLPAVGFFGQWDACGKDEVISQWHAALPRMRSSTHVFAELGHFIEEDKGPEIADAIVEMWGAV